MIDSALLEAAALDEEQIAARARAADALGDGRPADRARAHARRDDVRLGGVRAPVLDARARAGRGARPPRRARARPRAPVRARARDRRDAAARAAARRRCPSCPATSSSSATCPATRATTPAATGTTRSRCPDGRFGIVIGDVGGRGMDAAATMGQIRNALRAYALKGAGPGEVLDDLHTLVEASAGAITFATVIYVVLDPATGAGELATAGHLPALLVGDGALRRRAALPAARLQRRRPCARRALHARARRDAVAVHRRPDRVAPAPARRRARRARRRGGRRATRRDSTRSPTSCWSSCPPRATTTSRCSGCAGSVSRRRCA